MEKYFGNFVTTMSTLMVLAALGFVVYSAIKQKKINLWGRRIAVLALFGLALCCFVATRDNYHLSVQSSFDQTVSAGLFTLESIQSTVCSIGGAIIALASISSIFVKKQRYRKIMFFIIGVTMLVKTLVIEISRGVML